MIAAADIEEQKACKGMCYAFFDSCLWGRLAQLVRATGLHPVGWGFESLTAHHLSALGGGVFDIGCLSCASSFPNDL